MAVSSGFFNSVSGDRSYNASDFGSFFDGIINDGVFTTVGDLFKVTPGTGMNITVGSGKAWFKKTYIVNDAPIILPINAADSILRRIDAVVLDFNVGSSVRNNDIVVLTGTPGTNPDKPTLINEGTHRQYAICYITIPASSTEILPGNIEDAILSGETPAAEALLEFSSKSRAELETKIDEQDNAIQTQVNAIKKPTFTEAAAVANISGSGEDINTIWGKVKKMFSTILNKLPVQYGGTGRNTHTENSVLLGNGTGAIINKASTNGAFYATGANTEPLFGTLPAAQGGTGNTSLQATRNAMGLGNTTGPLPVANGGTGKSSITSGYVLVGNGTSAPSEKGIDTTVTKNSANLITSGAVEKALEDGHYGDMLKSVYDTNEDGIIDIEAGGTGAATKKDALNLLGVESRLQQVSGGNVLTLKENYTGYGFTIDTDGTITINTVQSSNVYVELTEIEGIILPAGKYTFIINDTVTEGTTVSYGCIFYSIGSSSEKISAHAKTITLNGNQALHLFFKTGISQLSSGKKVRVMLVKGDISPGNFKLFSEYDYNYQMSNYNLKQNFQAGVDTIYNAEVAQGVTPTASTPTALADGVGAVRTKGQNDKNSFTITVNRGSLVLDNGGSLTIYNASILINGIDITSFVGDALGSIMMNKPPKASMSKTGYASYTYKVTTS